MTMMLASGNNQQTRSTSHRQLYHDQRKNKGDDSTTTSAMMKGGPTVSVKLNSTQSEMSSISASHYSHHGGGNNNRQGGGRGTPTANDYVLSDEVISSRIAQGRCAICGLQTHQLIKKTKGLGFRSSSSKKNKPIAMKMIPLTNPMVYQGRCLLCYPIDNIPPPTTHGGIPNAYYDYKNGTMVTPPSKHADIIPPPPPTKVTPPPLLETNHSTDTMSTHTRSTRGTAATGNGSQESQKSALSNTTVQADDDAVEVHLEHISSSNKENFSFDETSFNDPWGLVQQKHQDESSLPKLFSRDSGDDNNRQSYDNPFHDQSFGNVDISNVPSSFKVRPNDSFQSTPLRKKGSKLANGISPSRTVSTVSVSLADASIIEEEGQEEELEGTGSNSRKKEQTKIGGTSVNSSRTNDSSTYTSSQSKNWWIPPTPASTAKASSVAHSKKPVDTAEAKEKEEQNSAIKKAVVAIRLATPQSSSQGQKQQYQKGISSSKANKKSQKPSEYIKTITKYMKAHKTSMEVQQAGCTQFFVLAADNVDTPHTSDPSKDSTDGLSPLYSAMLQYNVIELILNAMSQFTNAPEIQIPALGTLYILVGKHYNFQDAARDADGFTILSRTHELYSGDGIQRKPSPQHIEIQKMTCIAWANLVVIPSRKKHGPKGSLTTRDHQTLAAQCGAIPLILRSLEHSGRGRPNLKYNPGLSLFAAGALANLGAKHPDNMDIIRQETGVRILEDVYSYFESAEEERKGTTGSTGSRKAGKDDDPKSSYKPILQLLRAAIGNLEKDAIRFFATEEDLDEPMYSSETMSKVVDIMRVHSNSIDVVTEGCRLLWHMSASGSVAIQNDISDNIDDVLRDVGALDVLIEVLERHMPIASVADVACGALWNLTSASEENQDHVREVDGIKILAHVLSWYREPEHRNTNNSGYGDEMEKEVSSADVVGNCMCAVANVVARNVINQTCMRAVDVVPLIIDNMNEHVDMLDVQHFALGALANLSYNHYENSSEIVNQGGVDTILHIMERYQNHAEIQASACGALSNICAAGGDEARDELQSINSIRVLRDAATNFPKACGKYVDEIVSPAALDPTMNY